MRTIKFTPFGSIKILTLHQFLGVKVVSWYGVLNKLHTEYEDLQNI